MRVYDLTLKRRSIRRFLQKPLSREILAKLVNAGRLAPSGANLQPLEFVVVDDKSLSGKVFATLKWAAYIAPAGDPPQDKRPVAYIVVLVNRKIKKKNGEVDAAAAIENMILVALDEGIGSCWLGSVDREALAQVLRIPKNFKIDSVLALGYPDESPEVEDAVDSIRYWKDERGVLHVPKRKLDEVIHFNEYSH
ncbi:MAG: nitroreductase [Calditrichaeota bacterium]|nr:nitroreductase [Calditrichota bacterium]